MAYWMITNREVIGTGKKRSLGIGEGKLTYWTTENTGNLTSLASWTA